MRNYIEDIGCCGTCRFSQYYQGDFVCGCEESDNFGLETDYTESCSEYEEKE